MIGKKKALIAASVAVAVFFSVSLIDAELSTVAVDRFVGNQYTPWDTERMVKHSDAIIYGTVLSSQPVVRDEIEYVDDTNVVDKVRKMPYQILDIKIEESIKGGLTGIVQVRDNMDAIVRDGGGQKIHVHYANSLVYEGDESGIFFIEKIDGEYVMDGHYGFLKKDGDQFKSGFLGDSAPADIEKAIRDLATRYG